MVLREELETEEQAEKKPAISKRRLPVALWIGAGVTMIALIARMVQVFATRSGKTARCGSGFHATSRG